LKSTLKGRWFQTIEERGENLLWCLCGIPQNAFQNLEKTLKAVYSQWRGVCWRIQVLLSCELINKYFKKIVQFLFGQTMYIGLI
jgi:hypothetical protein